MAEGSLGRGRAEAHPSLALIKYWGKTEAPDNRAATPSLAVTLDGLTTTTSVELLGTGSAPPEDEVVVGGTAQTPDRFRSFFESVRTLVRRERPDLPDFTIRARSRSDFPSSAGLASSASGFAALAAACCAAASVVPGEAQLSALARLGSASAARSIWGGFVRLDAGAEAAEPVHDASWWPSLRIVVVEVEKGPKPIPSREAMERTRRSSPYYDSWLSDAPTLMNRAIKALEARDLDELGPAIRASYLRMFATMFAADPPVVYWKPESLRVMALCESLRNSGVSAWETMDAGPQVKIVCDERDLAEVEGRLAREVPGMAFRICRPGPPLRVLSS